MIGALGFLGAVVYVPMLRSAFRFSTLRANDIALCLGAAMLSGFLIEVMKRIRTTLHL
jgi:hypothetical protein